jgi:hypothetical protein
LPCSLPFNELQLCVHIVRSRAHIQRCNGETDPNISLSNQQNEEDGCSLESGDIDDTEAIHLESVSRIFKKKTYVKILLIISSFELKFHR